MRTLAASVLILLIGAPASAEDRPKIGLALAGGGAKGGAHVGVLRVLEELNVPIDYIAGTSIGSIVGGFYAAGMTTDEIEEALVTANWDDLLRDKPARKDLSYRRKEEDARYLFDLELGVSKKGIRYPAGLINGQKLFFLLEAYTLPVDKIESFDDLPIPFRAVATDVASGEMVVLDRGNLASAIRASMALPAIFSPVERDGRLLVDGGMVNNVPVDIVFEMGADVVIAVDLGAPLSAREVENVVEVLAQTMRMLTRPNMTSRLEMADIVLEPPEISTFKTMEFDRLSEIIPLGAAAARARQEELRRYAVDDESYRRHREMQRPPQSVRRGKIAFVRIEGNERVDPRVIENQLRLKAGDEFDLDVLSDDLNRVYGLGDFERVDFDIEESDEGSGVVVRTSEKPWGPNYMHFGFAIQSDLDGETDLGVLGNVNFTRLNKRGAEWRNDVVLGTSRVLLSEFYQPLDFDGRWFVAPSLEFDSERVGFFEDRRRTADLDVEISTLTLDLGLQFTKFAEVRFGAETGIASVEVATGEISDETVALLLADDVQFGGFSFEVNSDRLDSATIPRDGGLTSLRLFTSQSSLGADADFDRAELDLVGFKSRGHHTFLGSLDAGGGSGDLPEYAVFTLGGFGSLSGFAENELRGQYLGVVRAGYYYNLFGKFYVGGWGELGNVWQDSSDIGFDSAIATLTAFVGMDLKIGPLYLAFGQAEEGRNKVYVSLGRTL